MEDFLFLFFCFGGAFVLWIALVETGVGGYTEFAATMMKKLTDDQGKDK